LSGGVDNPNVGIGGGGGKGALPGHAVQSVGPSAEDEPAAIPAGRGERMQGGRWLQVLVSQFETQAKWQMFGTMNGRETVGLMSGDQASAYP
jgi:hypothetical protein